MTLYNDERRKFPFSIISSFEDCLGQRFNSSNINLVEGGRSKAGGPENREAWGLVSPGRESGRQPPSLLQQCAVETLSSSLPSALNDKMDDETAEIELVGMKLHTCISRILKNS